MDVLLTAKYDATLASQISATTSGNYYGQSIQSSAFALFKQHQAIIRGVVNTSEYSDYHYEMDIGFDDDLLTGHTERSDGQQTIVSDIEARKCAATGKYNRCYKGDITVRSGNNAAGQKGSFGISWGKGTAKLDVRVPDQLELKFDHSHTGRVRDEDFSSSTSIDAKSLRSDRKGAYSYTGSVEKENGRWNKVQARSSLTDPKTGQKSIDVDLGLNQNVNDRRTGDVQRTINVKVDRKGTKI